MAGKHLDKNNLGYLGIDFQYKLAKIFVEDSKFFEDVGPIVDQNAFNDSLLRTFIGTLKDYYSRESVIPSYEMLNVILREKAKTNNELEEADELIKKLKFETSLEGYIFVKDVALKFFKQQNLIRVANKILDIAGKGDIDRYEECQKLLDDAAMAGQEDDFGYDIYQLQDKALANDYTVSIPTGIDMLDETLGGGLDKGKLGLLIAPAGFGKTSFTTAIDSYAATHKCDMNNHMGYKVLQIYFEDDDVDITRKHYSRITQTEARFMKRLDKPERDEITELLNNHPDKELLRQNLRLKHFKTGTKSASDIEKLGSIMKLYRRLGCTESDVYFAAAEHAHKLQPTSESAAGCAQMCIKKGDLNGALEYYKQALSMVTNDEDKADYLYRVANVYVLLKNYQQGVAYAQQSLDLNPEDGRCYLLMGICYASAKIYDDPILARSVFWVACDMFAKAKQVDASCSSDANKLIATYRQYFPSKEDVFFHRDLNEGSPYRVGGWVNRTTTCRSKAE